MTNTPEDSLYTLKSTPAQGLWKEEEVAVLLEWADMNGWRMFADGWQPIKPGEYYNLKKRISTTSLMEAFKNRPKTT